MRLTNEIPAFAGMTVFSGETVFFGDDSLFEDDKIGVWEIISSFAFIAYLIPRRFFSFKRLALNLSVKSCQ